LLRPCCFHGLLNLTGDHALDRGEEYFVETIKQSPAYYAEAHDNLQKAKALAYQSAGRDLEDGVECRPRAVPCDAWR
jgi:hypothetical protein